MVVWLAPLAFACTEFEDVPVGTCGNGVLEPGEACDTFAPDGQACGAPGQAGACRPICTNQASCPAGLACGQDGICRAPSGTFGEPIASGDFLGEVAFLRAADVDGDGLPDLLAFTGSGVSVRFSDSDGRFVDEFDFPVPIRRVPDVGDLDGDGRADAVVPLDAGVLVLLGRADRRMVAAPVRRTGSGPDRILAQGPARTALASPVRISVVDGDPLRLRLETTDDPIRRSIETNLSLPLDDAPTALVTTFVNGTLWVAVAKTGSTRIDVVRVTADPQAPDSFERQRFETVQIDTVAPVQPLADEGGTPGRPGLFLGDCSNDGTVDLVASVTPVPNLPLQAFAGPTFTSVGPGSWEDAMPCLAPPVPDVAPLLRFPLDVADVDGDGEPDVLARRGISSSLQQALTAIPQLAPWTQARWVDFNQDGRLDFVAISASAEGVELGLNAGGGRFNTSRVDTRSAVDALSVGDFDGDLFFDVAVNERSDLDDGTDLTRLLLLRGRVQGLPNAAEPVAAFPAVQGLATLPPRPSFDAVDDLFVEFTGSDPLSTQSSILLGSTQGGLFSLIEPAGGEGSQAVGARTGAFEAGTVKKDLLVAQVSERADGRDQTELVLYFGEGNGVFAGDASTRIQPSVCGGDLPNAALASLAVTRVSSEDATDSLVLFGFEPCASDPCTSTLYVVTPAGPDSAATCWTSNFVTSSGSFPGDFVVTDANANGVQDLVLSLEQSTGSDGPEPPDRPEDRSARRQTGLLVVWDFDLDTVRAGENGGTEQAFSGTDDYDLQLESAAPGEPGVPDPEIRRSAIGLLQADTDPAREAVAITDQGALLIQLEPGSLSEAPLQLPIAIFDTPELVAADFTQDGIDDLVIAQGDRFDVLPGVPAEVR